MLVMAPAKTAWERTLWQWAEKWSGLKAIWQPVAGGRLAKPYLGLQVIANVKEGQDLHGPMSVTMNESIEEIRRPLEGFRTVTLSVNGYGPGCLAILESLRTSLDLEEVQAELEAGDLASIGEAPLTDLSEKVDTLFEERGNLTLDFSLAQEAMEELGGIGYFKRAEGTGTMVNGPQETEHEFEAPKAP